MTKILLPLDFNQWQMTRVPLVDSTRVVTLWRSHSIKYNKHTNASIMSEMMSESNKGHVPPSIPDIYLPYLF